MSRDQRAEDNWALYHFWERARSAGAELKVFFSLAPSFLQASSRHYAFMMAGLQETEQRLAHLGIHLDILRGEPVSVIPRHLEEEKASLMVMEFDPLRIRREWTAGVLASSKCGVEEVDAHNTVPCRVASPRQEWAAYALRPKLNLLLPEFLEDVPPAIVPKKKMTTEPKLDREEVLRTWAKEKGHVRIEPGAAAGIGLLRSFIRERLDRYPEQRNDPNMNGQSGLSPYLHFGQVSAKRVALEVIRSPASEGAKSAFLEELIVRRELAENLCHHRSDYDKVRSFPAWASETLSKHAIDRRDHEYTIEELERANTHDDLWNAAQRQMVSSGTMHGYMRMYWAKKILEWSRSPEDAMQAAVALNDRYEMDGRNPNGYAGIAWSIGGVHDRAWPERPIFGKVRYMSIGGARSKFDVDSYVKRWS